MSQVEQFEPVRPPAKQSTPPDFEQVVKTVLATFAVFTGLTISNYLKDTIFTADHLGRYHDLQAWVDDWQCWAFAALVCLLLRYLIGSAIHLNHVYVTKPKATNEPRSRSVTLLFKDLLFLGIFGVIAVFISKAGNAELFVHRAGLFLLAGLTWSIVDVAIRALWCDRREHPAPIGERPFWLIWILLDGVQLFFTWVALGWIDHELTKAQTLAIGFLVFLYLDILAMVRAVQKASAR